MVLDRWKSAALRFIADERHLLVGVAGVGTLKIASTVLLMLTTVQLARLLGPAQFGAYSFAFSIAALFTLPILQGLPTLVLREVSHETGTDRDRVIVALLRFSSGLIAAVGFVLLLLYGICSVLPFDLKLPTDPLLVATAIILPLVMVATLVRSSVIRAYAMPIAGQVPDMLVRPGLHMLLLVMLWWMSSPTAGMAMALHVVAGLAALGVATWLMRKKTSFVAAADSAAMHTGAWTKALLPLSTVAGMQLLNSQVDLVALGFLGTQADVGVYRIATTLALQVSFVLTVVNAVAAPKFARLYREGRIAELQRANRSGAGLSFGVGLAIVLVYVVFGRSLIGGAVGTSYGGAYVPLLVLSGAHLLTLWAGTTNVLLNMIRHERDVMVAATLASIVNIVLNVALIPHFGMLGASIGSATSLFAWRALLSWYLRKRLVLANAEP